MNKIILSIAVLTIIGAGCSVKSGSNPTISAPMETYKVEVIKSVVLKSTLSLTAKNPTSIEELMLKAGNKFESRKGVDSNEVVTKLDGVISTASKFWNLYVNNEKINFKNLTDITVKPSDKIEWRYENVNN